MEEAYPSFQPIPWQLLSLLPSPATHPPPSHVSWEQTAAAHLYSADLPGVRKEDIRVEVEDLRYLIIRTELDDDDDERSFIRKFRLPGMVDVDGISAEYTHGVLTVTVPRIHTRAAPRINLVRAGPGCDSVARAA